MGFISPQDMISKLGMFMEIDFYESWGYQIEITPRITVLYNNSEFDGFIWLAAIEWLWFGVSMKRKRNEKAL